MTQSQTTKIGIVPREIAMASTGLEFLRGMIDGTHPAPPFAETSSMWLTEAEHGRVVFMAEPAYRFYNPLGTVHGGWISTVLDSAMGCAVHSTLPKGAGYTTIDMTISFVRGVFDATGIVRCEGKIIHSGGRIATSEGRLWDAKGTLLAHGTETCMILRP